jgi:hypothetical protein
MIKRLFIAIPTPGMIQIETALSLCGVVSTLVAQRVPHQVNYFSSADIVHSRNRLAAAFLADPKNSHILFIDGDIGFDPRVIDDLAKRGADFAACDYPRRTIDFEVFRSAVEADIAIGGKRKTATADLLARTASYTFRKTGFDGAPWPFVMQGGFLSVPAVGFGLALIARRVFEQMIAAGAVEPVAPDPPKYPEASSFGFFERVRDSAAPGWLSEDLSFCQRWVVDCGGEIWIKQDTAIRHIGDYPFSGNLARHFEAIAAKRSPVQ